MPNIHTQPEQHPHLDELRPLADRLRDALRRLIAYQPGVRPIAVGRKFGVNKDVASRLVACCQIDDPIEFAYRCPSPATIRRVVEIAREQGSVGARGAAAAVDEFEQFVRAEFGDQSSMNVLLGSVHPDLGAKAEAAQKQSAFRGMSQLHGLFAGASIQVAVLSRSEIPDTLGHLYADGAVSLRRLRPGPPIVTGSWRVDPRTGARAAHPGVRVITDNWGGVLGLDSAPGGSAWVRPRIVPTETTVQVCVDADVLGTRAAVSFGTIAVIDAGVRTAPNPAAPWCGVGQLVSVPSKLLVYDLLVEHGLFNDAPPRLVIYDTAMRGTSPLFDPAREFDRLHLRERVDPLPAGPSGHQATDAPFLPDLVRIMLESVGLEKRRFHGYRLRQTYPIYGSQVAFAFPRG